MRTAELLKKYGIKLKRSLGQNFLSDERIARKIVELSGILPSDFVVEIGAGAGTLTEEILKMGATVTAFEIDEDLRRLLEERLERYGKIRLIFADFLRYDLSEFGKDTVYMGNIPYHITSPILEKILLHSPGFKYVVLMVQKELATRMMSTGRSRNFSSLSVLVNYFCKVDKLFDVSKSHFVPNPQVDSTVLKLTPLNEGERENLKDPRKFFEFSRMIFSKRRKKMRNSLRMAGYGWLVEYLKNTEFSWILNRRVEEIDLDVLIRIFKFVEDAEILKKD